MLSTAFTETLKLSIQRSRSQIVEVYLL